MTPTTSKYIAENINNDLLRIRNAFSDLNYVDDGEEQAEINIRIKYLSIKVFQAGKVFFEGQGLLESRKEFTAELEPILNDNKKLLAMVYIEEAGEAFGKINDIFIKHFDPFPEFDEVTTRKEQTTWIPILENILKATPFLVSAYSLIAPSSESIVYNYVKSTLEAAFPEHKSPKTPFLKGACEYKPDILLPLLESAVEYKFATDLPTLNKTLDQILIDVEGYDEHPNYKNFYAVFYVKSGVTTKMKFKTLWNERKFPENWKPIFVEGPVSKKVPTKKVAHKER